MHARAQNEERTSKVLFFGDVIGKPGRKALLKALPELRAKYDPDFVIVNVENLAHGKGVTIRTMEELSELQIDAYTSGNHIFDKGDLTKEAFEKYPNLLRPSNYKGDLPGRGYIRIEKEGQGYLVINLNATVFFEKQFRGEIGNPFLEFDRIIEEQKRPSDIVFVDFHSEATSEKKVFGFYTDGRATLVCGTHTHVPTADLRILPKGTAHVSDVGMIGALNSVLGVPIQNSLEIFMGGKFTFEIEEANPIMLNAVFVEARNGLAIKTEKIYQEMDV
jgi:2',3'-cyclic-nucleotide 2'-phosphodiesterase